MDTGTLSIIISAATAIVVPVVTIFFTTRSQRKLSITIEKFKREAEDEKEKSAEKRKAINESLEVYNLALEYLQKIKDGILAVTSYQSVNRPIAPAVNEINTTVKNFFELYAREFPDLTPSDRDIFHGAKSFLGSINNELYALKDKKQMVDVRKLIEHRARITTIQQDILTQKLLFITTNEKNTAR